MLIKGIRKSLIVIQFFICAITLIIPFGLKFNPWEFQESENGFGQVFITEYKIMTFFTLLNLVFLAFVLTKNLKEKPILLINLGISILPFIYACTLYYSIFFIPKTGLYTFFCIFPIAFIILLSYFLEKKIKSKSYENILDD